MALDKDSYATDDVLHLRFDLANTGAYDGTEVAQVYIRDLVGSVTRPVKELKAFRRVSLKAGETRSLTLDIPVAELAFYGLDMQKRVEPGQFQLWVAGDSASGEPLTFSVKCRALLHS